MHTSCNATVAINGNTYHIPVVQLLDHRTVLRQVTLFLDNLQCFLAGQHGLPQVCFS